MHIIYFVNFQKKLSNLIIINAAKLAVYEAVNVKQRQAQIFAMNLAEKLLGCFTRVAARKRSTQTSHNAFPNEKVSFPRLNHMIILIPSVEI